MQLNLINSFNAELSASDIFDKILLSRGVDEDGRESFLNPKQPNLSDLMPATGIAQKTLDSIKKIIDLHISKGDDICVFGDYDADGITATAVLWQAIIYYAKGKNVRILPFIPDRYKHGYGLSTKAVDEIYSKECWKNTFYPDFSPKLIITVDNGIVANTAADLLREKQVELIITDHHQPGDVLPHASEILHTTETSGAGIAWILSLFLLEGNEFAYKLIDLATIGIVADLMPLNGINRAIVVHGLKSLSKTKRIGLLSLFDQAKIDKGAISTYTIGFAIAPRINAAGRLYDPYDALRLLCSTNQEKAKALAIKINSHNQDRQDLTELALSSISHDTFSHKIIVVVGDYHEGIIGLIAGRLTELTHKPTIVMSNHGDSLKASARSIPGVNITELLRSLSIEYLSLGGHSAAAGFGILADMKESFLNELYETADSVIPDELLEQSIKVDFELSLNQITLALAKLISDLEPFGIGNPKPKFLLRNLDVVEDKRLGTNGKHRKLMIDSGAHTLEILLFNTKEPYPLKNIALLVGTLDINKWNNREKVQLIGSYVEI